MHSSRAGSLSYCFLRVDVCDLDGSFHGFQGRFAENQGCWLRWTFLGGFVWVGLWITSREEGEMVMPDWMIVDWIISIYLFVTTIMIIIFGLERWIKRFEAYDAFKTVFQTKPAENFGCMGLVGVGEDLRQNQPPCMKLDKSPVQQASLAFSNLSFCKGPVCFVHLNSNPRNS